MANYNKVILAGNLTRDPELSYLPSGLPVCEFGMAINRRSKSQSGEQREFVTYVDVRIFGKGGEIFKQYMSKGRPALIDGELRYDSWEGKDGQKRSKLYVVANNFQFLGSPGEGGRGRGAPQREPAPARAGVSSGASDEMPPYGDEAPNPDIPF